VGSFSRRSFLKLNLLTLMGWYLPRPPHRWRGSRADPGRIGRVATDEKTLTIHQEPSLDSEVIRETTFDELLSIYYSLEKTTVVEGEEERKLWHRVWGGYLPGAYVQLTRARFNNPRGEIHPCGDLGEITVPYTDSYTKTAGVWDKKYRLYYQTTHWITGIGTGPDGEPWYQLTSELSDTLTYYVPREHIRIVPAAEYLPTRIQVPPHEKRIEVDILHQVLTALEYGKPIYSTSISSGIGYNEVPHGTGTPTGTFYVTTKYPSKQMGNSILTGAPGSYFLPGVPWSTFFIYETGVAFHGTYWHNNFGSWMSHGCVNMRNQDAKWLFRWVTPAYDPPYKDHCDWYQTGRGTRIEIR